MLTLKDIGTFFRFFGFGLIALTDWLRGFPVIDTWLYKHFLLKGSIILVGLLVTPIPLWLLALICFLPVRIAGGIFFLAFIVAFAH